MGRVTGGPQEVNSIDAPLCVFQSWCILYPILEPISTHAVYAPGGGSRRKGSVGLHSRFGPDLAPWRGEAHFAS